MHQTSQRRFCRLVFLVACIVPTLAVMAWACVEKLPNTTDARLRAIEHALGLRVAARHLNTPEPGTYRAYDLAVSNIETGASVLTVAVVDWDTRGTTNRIRLSGVRLSSDELPLIVAAARRFLAVDWPRSVLLEARDLRWQGAVGDSLQHLLQDQTLSASLRSNEYDGQLTGRQLLVKLGEQSGLRLDVHRNWQVSPPATRLALKTAGNQVPTAWFATLLPAGGVQATFAGELTVTGEGAASNGKLNGELNQVLLAELTQLPIDATGSIRNLEMEWNAGRMTSAQGVVNCGPGVMAGGVARTLQSLYQSPQRGALVAKEDALEFGNMGVTFVLNGESLSLWGACPTSNDLQTQPTEAPCLVDNDDNILFGQPNFRAPLDAIANVLASHGTERAAELTASLPRGETVVH